MFPSILTLFGAKLLELFNTFSSFSWRPIICLNYCMSVEKLRFDIFIWVGWARRRGQVYYFPLSLFSFALYIYPVSLSLYICKLSLSLYLSLNLSFFLSLSLSFSLFLSLSISLSISISDYLSIYICMSFLSV